MKDHVLEKIYSRGRIFFEEDGKRYYLLSALPGDFQFHYPNDADSLFPYLKKEKRTYSSV